MKLLPKDLLIKTGEIDQAQWNFSPFFGRLQRQRFRMAERLLNGRKFKQLLEVGYGSGIFLPQLATHAEQLSGIDVHDRSVEVQKSLERVGVRAELHSGSATNLPFPDTAFDAMVSISALEFVEPIEQAVAELARVCQANAVLIVICPARSSMLDKALWLTTGGNAEKFYGTRRETLLPALQTRFTVRRQLSYPPLLSACGLAVYHAWELSPHHR